MADDLSHRNHAVSVMKRKDFNTTLKQLTDGLTEVRRLEDCLDPKATVVSRRGTC